MIENLIKVHRDIGKRIFGKPSPIEIPFEIWEPGTPEIVREALGKQSVFSVRCLELHDKIDKDMFSGKMWSYK